MLRSVVSAVAALEQSEGHGARVWRSIGGRQRLDPFLMLDEFRVTPPAGFPDHPHRGFETVTYMIEGAFQHEDSKGNRGTIHPGDVQWFTTGKGALHAEMPATDKTRGLQLWVNLPKALKMCEPTYQEMKDSTMPRVHVNAQGQVVASPGADVATIKIIAGEAYGASAQVITRTPTMYLDVQMPPLSKLTLNVPEDYNAFVYVLQNDAKFGATEQQGNVHTTLILNEALKDSSQTSLLPCTAGANGCRFVLIAGRPVREPIAQHGPFVMNTAEEIQATFMDFRMARNGFESAASWKSTIGQNY